MKEMKCMKSTGSGLMLAFIVALAASAAEADNIQVEISYSDAAIKQLHDSSEQVIVRATYFASPSPGSEAKTNEIGMIDLGSDEVQMSPSLNKVILHTDGMMIPNPDVIGGPITVNINVYSARLSGTDNILSCDFFEGSFNHLLQNGVEFRCFLIGEQKETLFKSWTTLHWAEKIAQIFKRNDQKKWTMDFISLNRAGSIENHSFTLCEKIEHVALTGWTHRPMIMGHLSTPEAFKISDHKCMAHFKNTRRDWTELRQRSDPAHTLSA